MLLYQHYLVIPTDLTLRKLLLQKFHASTTGGHASNAKTFHQFSLIFIGKACILMSKTFFSHCQVFQQREDTQLKQVGLLQLFLVPDSICEDISVDFITGLPASHGCTTILVIVDLFASMDIFFLSLFFYQLESSYCFCAGVYHIAWFCFLDCH